MKPYIVSLLSGVLAGAIYSLVRVRSPAPPMIALVGLLGMVIGTQIIPAGRELLASTTLPVAKTVIVQSHTMPSQQQGTAPPVSRTPTTASPG